MIAKPLFRKNYFLFVGIIVLVFALFSVFQYLTRSINRSISRERMVPPHHEMIEGLLNASGDPVKTLREFRDIQQEENFVQMDIVRKDGKSALDGAEVLLEPLSEDELARVARGDTIFRGGDGPPAALVSALKDPTLFLTTRPRHHGWGGPPPPPPEHAAGAGSAAAAGGAADVGGGLGSAGTASGSGAQKAGLPPGGPRLPPPFGGPGPGFGGPPGPPIFVMLSFLACICISVGIALLVFFSNYRQRAEESLAVLNALKSGDLTARMPTGKLDELAPLTSAFNHMADEIQRLFETLRNSDEARRRLLQDLAHDLRTPLASLRTFVETLQDAGERLSGEKRGEILQLCRGEIDYFSNLVEDLLFLAQITEPKYTLESHAVDLQAEIEAQVQVFRNRSPQITFAIEDHSSRAPVMQGSPKLIARLLRNALANSAHHARGQVKVLLGDDGVDARGNAGAWRIAIEDDGAGFSASALDAFGIKKGNRVLSEEGGIKKISVGIGSVIMREIAQLHGGVLRATNRLDEKGVVRGARVEITLR